MNGDFSRITFDPRKKYTRVLKQQGRVDLDSEWNEQQAINQYRSETTATDIIGGCGVPMGNMGFGITLEGNDLLISAGHLYVDGILCELLEPKIQIERKITDTQLQVTSLSIDDRKLKIGDLIRVKYSLMSPDVSFDLYTKIIQINEQSHILTFDKGIPIQIIDLFLITSYTTQDDYPNPPAINSNTNYLVYLDVWERYVSALEDPYIREKALSCPDTSSRARIISQVKICQNDKITGDCNLPIPDIPTTGTLLAYTKPSPPADNPCLLPADAGYRSLENQLYRVEIHDGGELNTATFKWSRDNGIVVTSIEKSNGQIITVADLGRDEVLGFANGDWVEVIDDVDELMEQHGEMRQITNIDPSTREITLNSPPYVKPGRNYRLRRWDQKNQVTSKGVVITGSKPISIENGIEIQFSEGHYNPGDYWLIPARTAIHDIEWPPYEVPNTHPIPQPPLGIKHHYCRLAEIRWNGSNYVISDCRQPFLPLTELTKQKKPQRLILRYLGGDGQHGAIGEELPCPLLVGVEDEDGKPVDNVELVFVTGNKDQLNSSSQNKLFLKTVNGVAEVRWKLGESGDRCHRVTVRFSNKKLKNGFPLQFTSIAIEKEEEKKWPTITKIGWRNDSLMKINQFLTDGLKITFSEAIIPDTVTADTFIVKLEIPEIFKAEPPYGGHYELIIPGNITNNLDNSYTFKPCKIPPNVFKKWFSIEDEYFRPLECEHLKLVIKERDTDKDYRCIRCRVQIKGNYILSEKDKPLDGNSFGVFEQTYRYISLIDGSGDGIKGGDFESWFYLYLDEE